MSAQFSEKINLSTKSISALLFWWLLNGLQLFLHSFSNLEIVITKMSAHLFLATVKRPSGNIFVIAAVTVTTNLFPANGMTSFSNLDWQAAVPPSLISCLLIGSSPHVVPGACVIVLQLPESRSRARASIGLDRVSSVIFCSFSANCSDHYSTGLDFVRLIS